jgi:hypothetical protein
MNGTTKCLGGKTLADGKPIPGQPNLIPIKPYEEEAIEERDPLFVLPCDEDMTDQSLEWSRQDQLTSGMAACGQETQLTPGGEMSRTCPSRQPG